MTTENMNRANLKSTPFETGVCIDHYKILEHMDSGGMSHIYLAEDMGNKLRVAMKVPQTHHPKVISALRDEIDTISRLNHPGIVPLLDHGTFRGYPWFTMELLPYPTLAQYIKASTGEKTRIELSHYQTADNLTRAYQLSAFTEGDDTRQCEVEAEDISPDLNENHKLVDAVDSVQYLVWFIELLKTLAIIHDHGIIHRDLKPHNIIIKGDQPILIDFGIAGQFVGLTGRESIHTTADATGSTLYVAPEQRQNQFVDSRADMYSLGRIMYQCFTGEKLPGYSYFTGNATAASEHWLKKLQVNQQLPNALKDMITALLCDDSSVRVGFARDLIQPLEAIMGNYLLGQKRPEHSRKLKHGEQNHYLYRSTFVGRENFVTRFKNILNKGESESFPRLCISGESGIGKTRLAMELSKIAQGFGFETITTACQRGSLREDATFPFGSPLQALGGILDLLNTHLLAANANTLNEPWVTVLASQHAGIRGLLLANFVDPLKGLIAKALHQKLYLSLAQGLNYLAQNTPLLLIIDDLQWSDSLSLAFLQSLDDHLLLSNKVFVTLIVRNDQDFNPQIAKIIESKTSVHFSLPPLTRTSVEQIALEMLAKESLSETVSDALFRESQGNPFYVGEYLLSMIERSVFSKTTHGKWRLNIHDRNLNKKIQSVNLPDKIEQLLQQRLQKLVKTQIILLQWIAIIGGECRYSYLALFGDIKEPDLQYHLNQLVELRLIQIEAMQNSEDTRIVFCHDKYRQHVYQNIPVPKCRLLQEKTALMFESIVNEPQDMCVVLAQHWARANSPTKALFYFDEAAKKAKSIYANHDIIGFLENMLQQLRIYQQSRLRSPSHFQAAEIWERLGLTFELINDIENAQQAFRKIIALPSTKNSIRRARAYRSLGRIYQRDGKKSLFYANKAHKMLKTLALSRDVSADLVMSIRYEQIQMNFLKLRSLYWQKEHVKARTIINETRPLVMSSDSDTDKSELLSREVSIEVLESRNRPSEQTAIKMREAVKYSRKSDDVETQAVRLLALGFILLWSNNILEADLILEQAKEKFSRIGDPIGELRCKAYLSLVYRQKCDIELTRKSSVNLLAEANALGMVDYQGIALANISWLAWKEGDFPKSQHAGLQAIQYWDRSPTKTSFNWLAVFPVIASFIATQQTRRSLELMPHLLDPEMQKLDDSLKESIVEFNHKLPSEDKETADIETVGLNMIALASKFRCL